MPVSHCVAASLRWVASLPQPLFVLHLPLPRDDSESSPTVSIIWEQISKFQKEKPCNCGTLHMKTIPFFIHLFPFSQNAARFRVVSSLSIGWAPFKIICHWPNSLEKQVIQLSYLLHANPSQGSLKGLAFFSTKQEWSSPQWVSFVWWWSGMHNFYVYI